MIDIMERYGREIEAYCLDNGLLPNKAFASPRSYTDEWVFLQHIDPNRAALGLRDEVPAPATLEIYLEKDGTLRFEQTEITRKYLGNEGCVEESERVAATA